MGSNTHTLVTFWFSGFENENLVLPTYLGLSQSPLSWWKSGGEFRPHFFTSWGGGGLALGSGAQDVYYQRKRKHILLAHCDREQTPFSWSLNYKFEHDKCVPSHCLCPGMSDSKVNAWGLKANATDPKDQLPIVSAAHSQSVFIYFHKLWIMNCTLTQHSCKHAPVGLSLALSVILSWGCSPLPFLCLPSLACLLKVLDCNIFPSLCDGIQLSPLGQCSLPSLQSLVLDTGSSISSLHFMMGCCSLQSCSLSSWLSSLWSHNKNHLEWHPWMQFSLLRKHSLNCSFF